MGKKLILIRHAKSDWSNLRLSDFDRRLNKRGQRDAPWIGERLMRRNIIPETILCSSSIRTRLTLELFLPSIKKQNLSITYLEAIYEASVETLLLQLQKVPSTVQTLGLIGHNPGMTDLQNLLSKKIHLNK